MTGITIIAEDDEMTGPSLLAWAIRESKRQADEEGRDAARFEVQLAPLEAQRVATENLARAQAVLLDEASLNKLMRYETHLSKQLTQTVHLLERCSGRCWTAWPAGCGNCRA